MITNETLIFPQRQYKDKLFRAIFNEKKYLIPLYNALNNSNYTNPDDFVITTIEDVIYITMKNDLSFMIDSYMTLYEHQSTFNPNMPLRGLIYFSQLYSKYISENDFNIHGSRLIKIPTPQFVVFYNGKTEIPDVTELKLSSAFEKPLDSTGFEWTAKMLNINKNHNKELLKNCKPLYDYSRYVNLVKTNLSQMKDKKQAVSLALDKAIEENLLDGYFLKKKMEVLEMILAECDMETFIESTKGAGYDEGLEAGIQQGLEQGLQQGLEQGNYQKSIETAKKMLELKKMSIEDISLCSGLPKETILQLKTQ